MDAFLELSVDDRRDACREAESRTRLRATSIEKDFWVCWTLRELFALPEWGPHFTFKGGTSLSKAWQLIDRFSEDIDVVIDREFLGFGGEHSPEHAPSRKQRRQLLDALKSASQTQIRESLQPALGARMGEKLPVEAGWRLEPDPADPDAQTLLFHYPTAFEGEGYVPSAVKIEFGARSDTDPVETPQIEPYLAETFPELLGPSRFAVRAVAARRTFWEKAMLLHEETYRPPQKRRGARLSRHYYDLWCLISRGIAEQALADAGLFERIAAHREVFFRYNWMDYATLRPGALRLLPPEEQRVAWAQDYAAMREAMFFDEAPNFEDILRVIGEFQNTFNRSVER
jgi:hypothetical protein